MLSTRHLILGCRKSSLLSVPILGPKPWSLWHPPSSMDLKVLKRRSSDVNDKAQDKIFTIPNLLCMGRIVASPYLAYSIVEGELIRSLAIFCLAGFSDLVSNSIIIPIRRDESFKFKLSSMGG